MISLPRSLSIVAVRPTTLHLSTGYVCGERSGPVAEGELDVGQRFANGHESSKAEAERLVRAAQQQGGISAVARPSIVVGR
jgi:thioester reductase-like protein